MNFRMIIYTTSKVLIALAVLMCAPLVCSLCYGEWVQVGAFALVASITAVVGVLLSVFIKPKTQIFFAKEGLVIVSLAWIVISVIGALPFVISGDIPSYVDALFEMVSGFTTTGASILKDVESLSRGMLFWRSFSHWVGGMGVLVFLYALFTNAPARSMHILRAEMPGPIVDKIVPKTKDTAKLLYIIYFALTLMLVIMLLCGGMDLYESLVHAFGTAGTGGFSVKANGIASYSPFCQWTIAIFMMLFGINFNVYSLILMGKGKTALKSGELWTYISIIVVSITLVSISISNMYSGFGEVLRLATFQVSSIVTTTGFTTANYNSWPILAKTVLIMLMMIGGCAGSTAGGLKVSRICIIFKKMANDLRKVLHPRTASVVKFEGKVLEKETISSIMSYLGIYVVIMAITTLLLSFDTQMQSVCQSANMSAFETNFTAMLACFNNIGPGMAVVGPVGNFADYSWFSKIVLTIVMLLGRLEIYPLLLTLNPTTWIKK